MQNYEKRGIYFGDEIPYIYLPLKLMIIGNFMRQKKSSLFLGYFMGLMAVLLFLSSCSDQKKDKPVALYKTYCASCHIAPSINDLPKSIWENAILPEMGARMGIRENGFDPYKGMSFTEQAAMLQTGIYPPKPLISTEDWQLLKQYIIDMAPDSLALTENSIEPMELVQFVPRPITLDAKEGAYFTHLSFDRETNQLNLGDVYGNIVSYDSKNDTVLRIARFRSPVVDYDQGTDASYATMIGSLAPSALNNGAVFKLSDTKPGPVADGLHRPSNTLVVDLNKDGKDEIVVSEYGDLTGQLSLIVEKADGTYAKQLLLNQPGTIRVLARDMDKDGLADLVVSTSQGDEGISILFQQEDLKFRADKVLRFSPVYGTSWFEMIDYDGDGDDDIITVNGDNADESYVLKPYHGLRIHLNDGNNQFEEKYFYPFYGATRVLANDFDKDGDVDFAVLSTFPDYTERPLHTFVYLENKNSNAFEFTPFGIEQSNWAPWFLMEACDYDQDGDDDIVLSAFSIGFTAVPEDLSAYWKEKNLDIMVLENKLMTNFQ